MRKVLYILGQLDDSDVAWLAESGRKRHLDDGVVLIREGESVQMIYLLLDGRLRVQVADVGTVADLGVGEIVGEISFVDNAPPAATVVTNGAATVLELPRTALAARLASDDGFGSRFYKAIALFLASRLRTTVSQLGYGDSETRDSSESKEDELDDQLLGSVSMAGQQFEQLIKRLERAPSAK